MTRRQRRPAAPPPRQIARQALAIIGSYSVSLPLVAAFLALLLMLLQTDNSHQRVEQVTNLLAKQQVERLSSALDTLSDRVGHLAKSNTLKRITDIEASTQTLHQLLPEAESLSLIPLGPMGIADKDNQAVNTLKTHIERDMLRGASETGGPIIDAFQHDRRWLIGVAHPVPDFGVLLARFPTDFFRQQLLQNLEGEAQVQMVAQYRNQARPIIAINIDQPSHITTIKPLPVQNWHISITPSQALLAEFEGQNTPLLLVILVCILIAVLNVLVSARARLALNRAQAAEKESTGEKDQVLQTAFLTPETLEQAPYWAKPDNTPADNPFDILNGDSDQDEFPPPPNPDQKTSTSTAMTDRQQLEQAAGNIFRAYDIRGIAELQLDDECCLALGRAIASEVLDRGHRDILLGRDGRLSSPRIHQALLTGLRQSGIAVTDLGLIPTPVLHFACFHLDIACGVMITGSHNAAEHNGLKIVMDRQALTENAIQDLKQRIDTERYHSADHQGDYREQDISEAYIQHITHDVALAQPMRVVIDAGNGATSELAPRLFSALGCRVEPLFCEVDGNFPNHSPDPTIEANLSVLRNTITEQRAHLGFAFDGDGDRLVAVTAKGHVLNSDQLMMILAQDVITRNPGCKVLYDVKCSRLLPRQISAWGGVPVMWKSGHSHMKRKMAETGALFGGEFSGHLFYTERWFGFDDGMYAAARLLEVLSLQNASLDGLCSELPQSFQTPELFIPVDGDRKFDLITEFSRTQQLGGTVTDIDGVRIDYADGWGLVRASNTSPALTLRFEADSQASLNRIINNFQEVLSNIDSELAIGF